MCIQQKPLKYLAYVFCYFLCLPITFSQSSVSDSLKSLTIYRAAPTKINNLVHTKLDVNFDYKKAYLHGKAWITLTPHFYPTDSLTLDAKSMDIKNVSLFNGDVYTSLNYKYDSLTLRINLGKTYRSTEKYTIYIDYTAKPNQYKGKGSMAITDDKGLYFINPDSSIKSKPVQIWTQGATESSSVWFPTIDKPNQKTTQEISMTVPDKYVTLSNGALTAQQRNKNGTRTDTWKMEQAHAPYLFMMAVGDFKIYHDKYKDIPVDYYLEPAYAPYAKDIFGKTPEMIDFFSKKLGVAYPWNKYAQIVVRDYVSGAMENTTATLHGAFVQQTKRELLDGSNGEAVIAHELFHQWFGDYVTTESWSNISVNESFADFSETLWAEYAEGKDAGEAYNQDAMQTYLLAPKAKLGNLVRFHYTQKEDVFDLVSYQKGGRILNMLRNYLGEDAFFKGLKKYLTDNAFGTAEVHQLRLAFEAVSGRDLNWFFNQWFYNSGHPQLNISYKWDNKSKTQFVYLNQTQPQKAFILPMKIDLYVNGKTKRVDYSMRSKSDTLSFQLDSKPELVNVDAEKVLLVDKKDHKSIDEFAFQYANGPSYIDRLEAVEAAMEMQKPGAREILIKALKDPYFGLRIEAINNLKLRDEETKNLVLASIVEFAKSDPKTLVRATAISSLANLQDTTYLPLFTEALQNTSYAVAGAALDAIAAIDIKLAKTLTKDLEKESKGPLVAAIVNVYGIEGGDDEFPYVHQSFEEASVQLQVQMVSAFAAILMNVQRTDYIQKGVSILQQFALKYKSHGIHKYVSAMLKNVLLAKQDDLLKAGAENKEVLKTQINLVENTIADIDEN